MEAGTQADAALAVDPRRHDRDGRGRRPRLAVLLHQRARPLSSRLSVRRTDPVRKEVAMVSYGAWNSDEMTGDLPMHGLLAHKGHLLEYTRGGRGRANT